MKDFAKNFFPCFAITLACFGGVGAMVFIFLALLPPELGTQSATEVARGAGGWTTLWHSLPLILFISALVASWVAAMSPFTSARMASDGNGNIIFLDPLL